MTRTRCLLPAAALALVVAAAAHGAITVGVTLSATGPAASLGIPEKNTFELIGTPTIAGQKVNFIILDDKSDTTEAVKNTRKLISEDKVDVIIGSTVTPNSLAMRDVVAEAEVPMISMAASAQIIAPNDPKTHWVFKTPQNDSLMADAIAVHMRANGVRTMGFIGFADAYGDSWLERDAALGADGRHQDRRRGEIQPQRHQRDRAGAQAARRAPGRDPDRRVRHAGGDAAQGSGRPRLSGQDLPDARRGQRRFPARGRHRRQRRVPAGRAAAGRTSSCPSPIRCASRPPSTSPSTKPSTARAAAPRSAATPGTPTCCCSGRFPRRSNTGNREPRRSAPRCATPWKTRTRSPASNGVFNITPADHNGMDNRARVMVKIDNGKWLLTK